MEIIVDDAVKEMILSEKKDFRVCTACSGPALVPITVKAPKNSDVKIPIGDNILYISAVQASYIKRVSIDMRYDSDKIFACSALNYFR
jgi:hypothetical protein